MSAIKNETLNLENTDAKKFIQSLKEQSLQCIICDPPFGINEDSFDKHYARDSSNVIQGYKSAPTDFKSYEEWCKSWIHEIPRVLKPDGTFYVVCAWNHVCDVELAIRSAPSPGLSVVNHIIWKYNFGVFTQKKFVTSHYHILRCAVGKNTPAFYNRAYFNETEKTADGHNAQYTDMEDVWVIPKEFKQGKKKNVNKLPDALVRKMILYSSKPGDWVADFFLGNFTTASVSRKEGRCFAGCELNEHTYKEHATSNSSIPFVTKTTHEKESTQPKNARKKITEDEKNKILQRFDVLHKEKTKKDSMLILENEFGRGHFSIVNILKANGR